MPKERTDIWSSIWEVWPYSHALVGVGITQPFTMNLPIWSTGRIVNCRLWYLLLVIVFFILNGIILYILGRFYKNRKREDVLPNEQIFAERYYAKQ